MATILVVAACTSWSGLTGGTWTLSGFGDFPPGSVGIMQQPETSEYTITFNPDGSVAVATDCTDVVGTYTTGVSSGLHPDPMTITLVPATPGRPCPEGSLSDAVLANLAAVRSYGSYNEGTVLTLFYDAHGQIIFSRQTDQSVPTSVVRGWDLTERRG